MHLAEEQAQQRHSSGGMLIPSFVILRSVLNHPHFRLFIHRVTLAPKRENNELRLILRSHYTAQSLCFYAPITTNITTGRFGNGSYAQQTSIFCKTGHVASSLGPFYMPSCTQDAFSSYKKMSITDAQLLYKLIYMQHQYISMYKTCHSQQIADC